MTEEFKLYLLNQRAALESVSHFDNLSDEELEQFLLEMLEKMGSPGFPPGMDTSREGLLDFIAGISAIANATPADEP